VTREIKEAYGSLPTDEKNEAPAPIGQKAQPTTAGCARKAAEGVTVRGAGSGPR
jgi:hypothetical protein